MIFGVWLLIDDKSEDLSVCSNISSTLISDNRNLESIATIEYRRLTNPNFIDNRQCCES